MESDWGPTTRQECEEVLHTDFFSDTTFTLRCERKTILRNHVGTEGFN